MGRAIFSSVGSVVIGFSFALLAFYFVLILDFHLAGVSILFGALVSFGHQGNNLWLGCGWSQHSGVGFLGFMVCFPTGLLFVGGIPAHHHQAQVATHR